jgi:predicted RNA-binding Zn-ribbon protein involved in translation (DUF1610 family)
MEIQETDTLIECPWCGVRHFLDTGQACYILPHKKLEGELIHVPYLRIKGSLFTCDLSGVHHKVIDTTIGATNINVLPPTLGLRPQAMKLQFATNSLKTTYLRHSMKWQDAIDHAAAVQHLISKSTLHKEWIGETFSTIYQPLILQDNLVLDGITGEKLAKLPKGKDLFAPIRMDRLGWQTTLLPTLCPNCGWDMQSNQASVIHLCSNCDTAWHNQNGTFRQVYFSTVTSSRPDTIYLPFWYMTTRFEGVKLQSLADFLRITNIPRIIKPEWENEPMAFFCPAFKIRPKIFLRVASQLTAAQLPLADEQILPKSTTPVSLPAHDAEESIKLILAHSTVAKKNIMPILPDINLTDIKTKLLFLPFFDNGYELSQETLKIVINKQILEWGKKL